MTFHIKNLGYGQLPAAKGTLYTVPVGISTIIKTVNYVNTCSVVGMTVNLFVCPSGNTSKYIIPPNLFLSTRYSLIYNDEMTLGPGDLIEGDATSATTVDYEIWGVEES